MSPNARADTPVTAIALRREPGPLARSLTALLLRVALGMIFLLLGLSKFQAIKSGKYPGYVTAQFQRDEKTLAEKGPLVIPLSEKQIKLFADALPYAEVGVGTALIVGVFTTLTAFLAGCLLLSLTFGHLVNNNVSQYPAMLTYILTAAAIQWLSPVTSNYLSVDGLLVGWFWKPRSEGEFTRNEGAETGRRI